MSTPKRCALYRHFDVDDLLLYLGVSDDPISRGRQHARGSDWVKYAVRAEVTWYDSRAEALAAEAAAIIAERPIFNLQHNDTPQAKAARARYLAAAGSSMAYVETDTVTLARMERNPALRLTGDVSADAASIKDALEEHCKKIYVTPDGEPVTLGTGGEGRAPHVEPIDGPWINHWLAHNTFTYKAIGGEVVESLATDRVTHRVTSCRDWPALSAPPPGARYPYGMFPELALEQMRAQDAAWQEIEWRQSALAKTRRRLNMKFPDFDGHTKASPDCDVKDKAFWPGEIQPINGKRVRCWYRCGSCQKTWSVNHAIKESSPGDGKESGHDQG